MVARYPLLVFSRDKQRLVRYVKNYIETEKFAAGCIFEIVPAKKEFSLEEVKFIRHELIIVGKDPRLFVLHDFETASHEAQNALLKSLEEKSGVAQFLLLTTAKEAVLPTIRSRAKMIDLTDNKIKKAASVRVKEFYKRLAEAKTPTFLNDPLLANLTSVEAAEFITETLLYLRENQDFSSRQKADGLKRALRLLEVIVRNNVNPQLAVDGLLIYLWKHYKMIKK
ncbi:hypothetical protein HY214_00315 [Candidatus Roizmanbacteria bacterium]|nr:hypothetical protein [Candidatus Roizmanbacteria bacterium]